jgi:hypothetical protein
MIARGLARVLAQRPISEPNLICFGEVASTYPSVGLELKKAHKRAFSSTRGRIRTLNLLIRSQVLYPVELRTQIRRFLSGYEDNPSLLKKQVHYP